MNFGGRSRRNSRRSRTEEGFTLIEVLISVVLLTMITGAISAAFVSSLNQSSSTNNTVKESNGAQIISGFLVRDAEAAGGSTPRPGSPTRRWA